AFARSVLPANVAGTARPAASCTGPRHSQELQAPASEVQASTCLGSRAPLASSRQRPQVAEPPDRSSLRALAREKGPGDFAFALELSVWAVRLRELEVRR